MQNEDEKNCFQNDCKSDSIINDSLEKKLNILTEGLRNKPNHWTDMYWETISEKYKWFIHRYGNAGCGFCFNNTAFIGKKSHIGYMKLRLMELSYEEFERKLREHEASIQHNRSVVFFRSLLMQNNNEYIHRIFNSQAKPVSSSDTVKKPLIDILCPLCNKGYKLKKALVKHVNVCNNEQNTNGFIPPCGCRGCVLFSIRAIDEHNSRVHNNKFLFNCKLCNEQHETATNLYGHLMLFHDYNWNPYNEMPNITEATMNAKQQKGINGVDQKKIYSTLDEILLKYDKNPSNVMNYDIKPVKRKKQSNDEIIHDNKIEKKINHDKILISHLKLSIDQIYTCEFCGGRYLSFNILNEHVSSRHPPNTDNLENQNEHRQQISSNKSITASELIKRPEMENTTLKQDHFQKPIIDKRNNGTVESQVSACLLTCPMCQESFASLDDRNHHVSKQHPEIQQFICQHCGLIFTTLINYNRHVEKAQHHNALPKLHKNDAITTYSCTYCVLVFTNQADLTHHVNLSHPPDVTDVINTLVDSVTNLDDPVQNQAPKPFEMADISLTKLLNAVPDENRCNCHICGFLAHNSFELEVHCLTHNDSSSNANNLPSCPGCSRLFFGQYSKLYLKDHYNMEHLKKGAPRCHLCNLSFSSSYCLDHHSSVDGRPCPMEIPPDPYYPLMHPQKFAFACSQCGSIFAGSDFQSRLEVHNKTCANELMDEDQFIDD